MDVVLHLSLNIIARQALQRQRREAMPQRLKDVHASRLPRQTKRACTIKLTVDISESATISDSQQHYDYHYSYPDYHYSSLVNLIICYILLLVTSGVDRCDKHRQCTGHVVVLSLIFLYSAVTAAGAPKKAWHCRAPARGTRRRLIIIFIHHTQGVDRCDKDRQCTGYVVVV